ncbi:MAG: flavodoxin [Planctomycetota bacterium]
MKTAIVWASTTGNTQDAAEALQECLGELVATCIHIDDIKVEDMVQYDVVLIGVSTWDIGELQADWDVRVDEIRGGDWTNVTVGFFGGGDAVGYPDTFVDAFGILWELMEPRGARLIGKWPVDDYGFEDSRSLCDDRKFFLGLPFDDDNDPGLTQGRIEAWADQIRAEIAQLRAA